VAEIQQNSDTTYRLYDWGRTGTDGNSRPLHVRQALEVIDWRMIEPEVARPPVLPSPAGWTRELLSDLRTIGGPSPPALRGPAGSSTACPYFQVERLTGRPGSNWADICAGDTFQIWAALSGTAVLRWAGAPVALTAISWLLLPAALGAFELQAETDCVLLRIQPN